MENRILSLLWHRSEEAITVLSQHFGPRLYRTAMNILNLHQDAEEVVSDTYLALWHAIPPKKPEPLPPYVYRTGKNLALNRLRASGAEKRSGYCLSLEELSGCIAGPDLWEQLDARALGREINAFLDTISRENRVLFLRRYWFGDSISALAQEFHLSENALSVRLSRIRNHLKQHLIKEGFL